MERVLTEVPYYQTYYFANAIQSVIRDQFGYLRKLHDFYGDGEILRFVRPFERHSAFHAFIEFLIDDILNDDLSDLDLNQQREEEKRSLFIPADCRPSFRDLPINHALTFFSISHDSFESWLKQKGKSFSDANADDAYDYYQDLRLDGSWEELLSKISNEVFFIMFLNRGELQTFNQIMASIIEDTPLSDVPQEQLKYFARSGVLKRVGIPAWVQRAIFFRDRGHCTRCGMDVSGLGNISNRRAYDHMVPLAQGGLNDVTNIQLLCEACNRKKSGQLEDTSPMYEGWY